MAFEELFHRIADRGRPTGAIERAVQAILAPIGAVYGAGARTARLLYDLRLRPRTKLPATTISVGNITLGGTGKTPFTIWLVRWLQSHGRRPAVLSRGYGRDNEERLTIVQDLRAVRANARQAGDEPLLIARSVPGVPVLACASRAISGRAAVRRFRSDTLVLDDGFQHHAVARQVEIVLIDATKPLFELEVFPRGTLREPLSALRRAHLLVLTRCDQAGEKAPRLAKRLERAFPNLPVVQTVFAPARARRIVGGAEVELPSLGGSSAVVACGVGNPDSVRRTVSALGVRVDALRAERDHADWTARAVQALETERRRLGADHLIVTEKDAVKIAELPRVPKSLLAVEIELRFRSPEDERKALRTLRARLAVRNVRGYLD